MEEQGHTENLSKTPVGQVADMKNERPRPIEEQQVANAIQQLKGEFGGNPAIREEDVKKAVEEASKPVAIEETVSKFGQIRTDERGKPLPEDLPPSVRVKEGIVGQDDNLDLAGEAEKRAEEELARRDLLQRERYRRVERANFEEIEYYSSEQVALLFMRRMQTLLVEQQEHGKPPGDFKWVAQGEVRELLKVIQAQEEMQFIEPASWGKRGYPPLTVAQLVQMGDDRLLGLARLDKVLRERKMLNQEVFLTDQEEKALKKIEESLDKAAAQEGVDKETYIEGMEGRIELERKAAIREILPRRVDELKRIEEAISGFNNIYEFFTNVQIVLSPSVREYHDILEAAFGPRSRFEVKPPVGRDYKGIFEAPSLLSGTPEFGRELMDTSFRALRDALEEKAFVDRNGGIVNISVGDRGQVLNENDKRLLKSGDVRRLPNIFANVPSAISREMTIEFIKEKLFNKYSSLDRRNNAHQQLAEIAARFSILLSQHWDLDVSHSIKVDEEKGTTEMEVTYSDAPKLAYPMVRALNEARNYRALLGNFNYTGVMFRMTDNFLRVASPSLECRVLSTNDKGDLEEETVSRRVSLWDLAFKYGFNLSDLPWLGDQGLDFSRMESPELRALAREIRSGIKSTVRAEWAFKDVREDALNVPYFLHLNYVGSYYDLLTVNKEYGKLMDQLNGGDVWRDLNKPIETGFEILLSSRGLERETIFKLKVLAKVNLVASLLAALHDQQLVGKKEATRVWKTHQGGTGNRGQGMWDEDYYDAIFAAEFLPEHMDLREVREEIDKDTGEAKTKEVPYRVDTRGLIAEMRGIKRGIIPGDPKVKTLRFGDKEIRDIEKAGLWAPYRIVPRSDDDPFYILNALESVKEKPRRRA